MKMSFSESSVCVSFTLGVKLPLEFRAGLAFTLTLLQDWITGGNQLKGWCFPNCVRGVKGLSKCFRPVPLACVHMVTGTTQTFLCCIYGFLMATNENAESHPSYVRALLNKMWVDMWIIYVSKNKGSCDFCFALKYSPMHGVRQKWWCRVYSMIKHRNIHTCIQYCTNSAQLDVCLKNVHFNYDFVYWIE